jgi:uncharacterized SAM-dependent methyltransferase
MHVESLAEQTVDVAGATIGFDLGETIWTESSYKYDLARLERLTASSGLEIGRLFTDRREQFWVAWLRPR